MRAFDASGSPRSKGRPGRRATSSSPTMTTPTKISCQTLFIASLFIPSSMQFYAAKCAITSMSTASNLKINEQTRKPTWWINSFSIQCAKIKLGCTNDALEVENSPPSALLTSQCTAVHINVCSKIIVSHLISGSPRSRGRARHRATSARWTTMTSAVGRTTSSTFNKISIND